MADGQFDGRVFDRLESVLPWTWTALAAALADRESAWRTPVLSTAGLTGAPRARTIVLRGVDADKAELIFYSDRRAGKVADIARQPDIALLFYHAGLRLQVRAEGLARIEREGPGLETAWAALPAAARALYATETAPGTAFPGGTPAMLEDGRANFARLLVSVARLELLWLGPDRHRRCAFSRGESGWAGDWLIP